VGAPCSVHSSPAAVRGCVPLSPTRPPQPPSSTSQGCGLMDTWESIETSRTPGKIQAWYFFATWWGIREIIEEHGNEFMVSFPHQKDFEPEVSLV